MPILERFNGIDPKSISAWFLRPLRLRLARTALPKSGGSVVKLSFVLHIIICAWLTVKCFENANFL
jgi:hypothetical protein